MPQHHAQTMATTPDHEDMATRVAHHQAVLRRIREEKYPPLDHETREYVDTHTASFHLSLKARTLLAWGDTGPIKPVILSNGRKRWPVAGIRAMLKGGI